MVDLNSSRTSQRFAIINGDDFGMSTEVNKAIITAHEQGILTSTSLMVTGEAFEEAVALAQTHPNLAVGLHLVLVCGKSALPASQIPHLVDQEGNFPQDSVKAGLRYQFNPAARQELQQEIRAQLVKFRQTGLPLSHVDGHLHLHVHPVALQILGDLAEEFAIKFIRLPAEELTLSLNYDRSDWLTKLVWYSIFSGLRRYGENLLQAKGIGFTEKVYGLLQTGKISEEYLLHLIPRISATRIEIYAHPALTSSGEIPGPGERELEAFLSKRVRRVFDSCGFTLTNYHACKTQ